VRRLVSRAFALALLVPVTLLLGACVFAPDRAPFEVDGATRGVIALDVPAEYELAVWRSGPADAWPVIYVHGTPGSAGAFRSYLADPVEGTRSIAYDRPGFGETTPKRGGPSFQEQAAALSGTRWAGRSSRVPPPTTRNASAGSSSSRARSIRRSKSPSGSTTSPTSR